MVELLSPAGSFDSFLGALNAGADAVYLGGEKYSARAYADNLTDEQIIKALDIAHFYGKKVYLTLNTLLKDNEIDDVPAFIKPFYEHHLDGVIVQDFGAAYLLGKTYPDLPLHASTQMTVTGALGASFLKEKGMVRVVPARELQLEELRDMKTETGMELECFVHGAMCYCYSGQCLFSSILGGRSGNRGRCAQPCRLPYTVHLRQAPDKKGEEYPLSMKDLCTIQMIPELIEVGIDSFKIEGRMKSPAYTCGVTALYRKYIDRYKAYGREQYHVQKEDMEQLLKLYIRSDIHDGYYHRHNGKKMITPEKPSYTGSDDKLVEMLLKQYIKMPPKHSVCMQLHLEANQPARLRVYDKEGVSSEVSGAVPEPAANSPVTEEQVKKQMQKTGNSLLACEDIQVHMQEGLYVPLGALNQLRRQAVSMFEEKKRCAAGFGLRNTASCGAGTEDTLVKKPDISAKQDGQKDKKHGSALHVSVMTLEQLRAMTDAKADRLYVDADLWLDEEDAVSQAIRACGSNPELYLTLPYIVRKRDAAYYSRLFDLLRRTDTVKGVLIRNVEQIQLVQQWRQKLSDRSLCCAGDASIYQMNRFAQAFTDGVLNEYTLPYELNYKELRNLCETAFERGYRMTQVLYGRIPMMISANCIKKTKDRCDDVRELSEHQYVEDRYKKKFPVYNNCIHCYNVIYNSVPYSLHNKIDQISHIETAAYRLDFVTESGKEAGQLFQSFYGALRQGSPMAYVPAEFTAGHFSRGIE